MANGPGFGGAVAGGLRGLQSAIQMIMMLRQAAQERDFAQRRLRIEEKGHELAVDREQRAQEQYAQDRRDRLTFAARGVHEKRLGEVTEGLRGMNYLVTEPGGISDILGRADLPERMALPGMAAPMELGGARTTARGEMTQFMEQAAQKVSGLRPGQAAAAPFGIAYRKPEPTVEAAGMRLDLQGSEFWKQLLNDPTKLLVLQALYPEVFGGIMAAGGPGGTPVPGAAGLSPAAPAPAAPTLDPATRAAIEAALKRRRAQRR